MKHVIIGVTAVAMILGGCSNEPAQPIIKQGTAIEHGQVIFHDPGITGTGANTYSCATCHDDGTAQKGVLYLGGSLVGVTKRPSYWGGQEVDLLRAVNACLYYFMLSSAPWTAENAEAGALYGYLESISKGSEGTAAVPFTVVVSIAELPAGDATRGAEHYGRACGTCHGPAHTGKDRLVERAPVLPEQTLKEHPLGEYTADEQRLVFVEKARHGAFVSYSGSMPPLSLEALPDTDLADILQYLDLYKAP